tara:strand:+ start:556 stop:1557 length:1002 start_codon:yes stop_codon:yes gene_type:complete
MILEKKYVIGTHVMFFEIEMYKDFIEGLVNLLENVTNKDNVTIDLCFNLTENVEKINYEEISKTELLDKFNRGVDTIKDLGYKVNTKIVENEFYFHTDYRRDLNYNYCKKVDYVMWGETDSFFPKEAFQVIETLSKYTEQQNIHRYLLSFADRKMWDSSWDPLVHVDFKDHVFIDDSEGHLHPKQAKSQMSVDKMNEINAKSQEFNFTYVTKPKISGACLVLSSDLIKCGVNIPSCLLYNDDEGLSIMAERVMIPGTFIQFVCDNILHVHARRHPNKRLYVKHEDNPHSFISDKNIKFQKLLEMSKQNINSLHTGKNKFYEYDDLKQELEKLK